jgi:glycine cleavage system pyridoxal-binding protein P
MSYIATTEQQQREMLKICGAVSVQDLFKDIPANLRPRSFNLPKGKSELEVFSYFSDLAQRNYSHLIILSAEVFTITLSRRLSMRLFLEASFIPLTRPISRKFLRVPCKRYMNTRLISAV